MRKTKLLIILLYFSSLKGYSQASFTAPDTVCLNTPVTFTNTSDPNGTFKWNFCSPIFDTLTRDNSIVRKNLWPQSLNLIEDDGKYYGFVLEGIGTTSLTRIDYGRSVSSPPVFTPLGNFNGLLDITGGLQDIQIIKDNGEFFAFICGIRSVNLVPVQTLVRIDFSSSLENNAPTITDISSIGNLNGPASMSFKKSTDGWVALVANRSGFGSLIKLSFGNNLRSIPSVVNYGNFNNTFYNPNSVILLSENNNWFALFVDVAFGRVYKLAFGNSLSNPPAISRIPHNVLDSSQTHAWKLTMTKDCNYTRIIAGTLVKQELYELLFTSLQSDPVARVINTRDFFYYQYNLSNIITDSNGAHFFVSKIDIPVNTSGDTLFRFSTINCLNSNLPVYTVFNPPPVTFTKPGKYIISLIKNQNTATESIFCKEIMVLESTLPVRKLVSACQKDTVLLNANFTSPFYKWSNSDTARSIKVTEPGLYWVSGNSSRCRINADSFFVTFNKLPNVLLSKSNDISCSQSSSTLLASGAANYTWLPSRYFADNKKQQQIVTPDTTTTFTVIATDQYNCSNTAAINVKVDFTNNGNKYLVPNAFTPNNDGFNDCFTLKNWDDIKNFTLIIYNRWGQIIFSTTDIQSCWDGKYANGSAAPIGAYVYLATGQTKCDGQLKKSGSLILIR